MCVRVCVCIHACVHACVSVFMCVYMPVYMCVHACMHVCVLMLNNFSQSINQRPSVMAKWIKALASMTDNLNLIPEPKMGRELTYKLSFDLHTSA